MRLFEYSLLLWLLAPLSGFGQEKEVVIIKHRKPRFREDVEVLKTDPATWHGTYRRYQDAQWLKNNLRVQGHYTRGIRDSVWTWYYWKGEVIARGRYENDRQVGIWEYYQPDGSLEQQYDHSQQRLLFNKPSSDFAYKIHFKPVAQVPLDTNPVYIGGSILFWWDTPGRNFSWWAKTTGLGGTVRIAFTIDSQGQTSNYRVAKSVHPKLDAEAMRVVKRIPAKWVPTRAGGKAVAAECEIPIAFMRM